LYEGQFDMTTATTSSVWRSTGGDQTRTAAAGSMMMSQPFYVANAAATANVAISATLANSAVILPAGAVVTAVTVTETGTGAVDLGFTPLIGVGPGQTTTLGTAVPTALLNGGSVASRAQFVTGTSGAGASMGNVANATNLVVITNVANTSAAGNCSGFITYYVDDSGEENV
jgi:hypothetical protein